MAGMRLKAAAIAACGLLFLGGCGGGSEDVAGEATETPSSEPEALTAEVRVTYTNALQLSADALELDEKHSCESTPGDYSDIRAGAVVYLLDASSDVIASSKLEPIENINDAGKLCMWSAKFDDVPAGGRTYRAELGEHTSEVVAEADLETTPIVITP